MTELGRSETSLPPATLPAAAEAAWEAIPCSCDPAETSGGTVHRGYCDRQLPMASVERMLEAARPHLAAIVEPLDIKPGGRIVIRIAAPAHAISAQYAAEARARTLAALNLDPATPAVITCDDVQIEADNRAAELHALAADILSRFHATGDGHRARVGQVQIAKWQAVLDGGSGE